MKKKINYMHLVIKNPEKILFEGEVKNITSFNSKGEFSILLNHRSFISLIYKSIKIAFIEGKSQEYTLDSGLLKCDRNKIEVFLGIS